MLTARLFLVFPTAADLAGGSSLSRVALVPSRSARRTRALDSELSRRQGARRGRTTWPLLQARAPGCVMASGRAGGRCRVTLVRAAARAGGANAAQCPDIGHTSPEHSVRPLCGLRSHSPARLPGQTPLRGVASTVPDLTPTPRG